MSNFQAWKIIGYVEIFYYLLAAIVAAHLIYKMITSKFKIEKKMIYFLSVLVLIKITCGILSVVLLSSSNGNTNLAIAFVILNSIGIGLFLRMLLQLGNFVNLIHKVDDIESSIETEKHYPSSVKGPRRRPRFFIFRLAQMIGDHMEQQQQVRSTSPADTIGLSHFQNKNQTGFESPMLEKIANNFTLVCILLMSIGGGLTASHDNNSKAGKIILKVGSVFYIISVLSVAALLTQKLIAYQRSEKMYQIGSALVLLLLSTPLLLVRIVYTTCASFEFTVYYGPKASKFTAFYGLWTYYLGMSFIEECVAMALILAAGEIILHRIR